MPYPSIFPFQRQPYRYRGDAPLPPYVAVTEEERGIVSWLPPGSWVILRGYGQPEREKIAFCLAALCRRRRWKLLIAGDAALAVKVRAAGLHIPEWAGFRLACWRSRKPGWLLTMAAHNPSTLWRAARLGIDAVLYSPVFPTESHPGKPALGVIRFNHAICHSPISAYALGGINAQTIRQLKGSHAIGIAAQGMFRE